MRKIFLSILLVLFTSNIFAGVGDGTTIAAIDFAGIGYGFESHNKYFGEAAYYDLALKFEYVAFTPGSFAIGFQPYMGFGIGKVDVNPIVMGNIVLHLSKGGWFDPYVRIGCGVTRIAKSYDPPGKIDDGDSYTLSNGFFQVNAGLGTNLWFSKRIGISIDGNASFIGRFNAWAALGFNYKLRSPRKKK